jgi:DNA-directed RNA polymerase subunit RPC12/RpoP
MGCGKIKTEPPWYKCITCGYSPRDAESLTKQLLASDNSLSPRLLDIASKVKAGEPVLFDQAEMDVNWRTWEDVQRQLHMEEALDKNECPECGRQIESASDGGSVGLTCPSCHWSLWTSRID